MSTRYSRTSQWMKQRARFVRASLGLLGISASVFAAGCGGEMSVEVRPDLQVASALRADLNKASAGGAEEGASTDSATPTGWATLTGSFTVGGNRPAAAKLKVDKDESVCAPGGKQMVSEEFVIGDNGGLRDVLIFVSQKLPSDEPWTHPSAKLGKTDEVLFDQKECVFLNHVFAIQSSQPIRIKNSDPVGHNTSLKPKKNTAFDQTIPAGASTVYQPKAEEDQPFPVACAIHPWMKSWMIMRGNGYFAVTKPDGTFEIPNLPAGVDLEFRVWQEKLTFVQTVQVNGKDEKWSKGRFKQRLTAGEPLKLDVVIDGATLQ